MLCVPFLFASEDYTTFAPQLQKVFSAPAKVILKSVTTKQMDGLAELGLLGVFIMSFLAATVVPIGSETVVSAVLVAGGDFWLVILIATIGNTLGGMTGYYMGWLGKWEWIEKYLKIKREKVERFQDRIYRHGGLLAALCWLPGVGDFIAIGLGFFKADWRSVAVFMFIGKFLRFAVWAYLTVWVLQEVQ